jgi:hypothetical protein
MTPWFLCALPAPLGFDEMESSRCFAMERLIVTV